LAEQLCFIWSPARKDESPSLTGAGPRPLEITQALKSICEMYKQRPVFIYSIVTFSMYPILANSTLWKEELKCNTPVFGEGIKHIQQTQGSRFHTNS